MAIQRLWPTNNNTISLSYDDGRRTVTAVDIHDDAADGGDVLHIELEGIVGFSNAVVYRGILPNDRSVAVKFSRRDPHALTMDKIGFLEANRDIFATVHHLFRNLRFRGGLVIDKTADRALRPGEDRKIFNETEVDVCIMEMIDQTLDNYLKRLGKGNDSQYHYLAESTVRNLLAFLVKMASRLNAAGLYYLDVKLENIGIVWRGMGNTDLFDFRMIDVDSIVSRENVLTTGYSFTPYTGGLHGDGINLWRAQLLTVLYTTLMAMTNCDYGFAYHYNPRYGEVNGPLRRELPTLAARLHALAPFPRGWVFGDPANDANGKFNAYRGAFLCGSFVTVYDGLAAANVDVGRPDSLAKYFLNHRTIAGVVPEYDRIVADLMHIAFLVLLPIPIHTKERLIQVIVGQTDVTDNNSVEMKHTTWRDAFDAHITSPGYALTAFCDNAIISACVPKQKTRIGNDGKPVSSPAPRLPPSLAPACATGGCRALEFLLALFSVPSAAYAFAPF